MALLFCLLKMNTNKFVTNIDVHFNNYNALKRFNILKGRDHSPTSFYQLIILYDFYTNNVTCQMQQQLPIKRCSILTP